MKSSTTAIIVSYKSKWIIENCIKSIDSNTRIIVVENSNDYKLKNLFVKYYNYYFIPNCFAYCSISANVDLSSFIAKRAFIII